MKVNIKGFLGTLLLLLPLVVLTANCGRHSADLPRDILGISIGMSKEDATRHLEEIASLESANRKVGQHWKLKNDTHFTSLGIDFDKENQVRFITAFVEKASSKEKYKFADIGDLTQARAEIAEPHYRYIWEVPAEGDKAAYIVNIYGDNPEFVTVYSLAKKN